MVAAHERGDSLVLPDCEDCPEFVAVPTPPEGLRRIAAVAKYELTWREYLASYDAGACPIPNRDVPPIRVTHPNPIPEMIDKFRIDWPVTFLSDANIECYLDWVSGRTGFTAVLPTEKEWEWFARAGVEGRKYPWGNDASSADEALFGVDSREVELDPWPSSWEGLIVDRYLRGIKVGQYQPNAWGIHDLMGNSKELTADRISWEDWIAIKPSSKIFQGLPRAVIKGEGRYDRDWRDRGISGRRYSIVWDGQHSLYFALRVVLLGGKDK